MPQRDFSRTLRWMREGTERRRRLQSRRKQHFAVLALGFLVMLAACLPSFLSYTSVVHSLIEAQAKQRGWSVHADTIRIGWITPLHIDHLEAIGPSGKTILVADALDASLTVLDLLRGSSDTLNLHLQDPRMEMQVMAGGSSLEEDVAALSSAESSSESFSATVEIRNGTLKIIDAATDRAWRADQLQASLRLDTIAAWELEGVFTDPDSISGAIQASGSIPVSPRVTTQVAASDAVTQTGSANGETAQAGQSPEPITMRGQFSGVPLSLVALATVRFPEAADGLPDEWSGNVTGKFEGSWSTPQQFSLTATQLDMRNLSVQDRQVTGGQRWKLGQALINGTLQRRGNTLRCDQLALNADTGTANFNGTVDLTALFEGRSTSAISGDFQSVIDLALLTRAAPGLLPVRDDAAIDSGQVQMLIHAGYDADERYRSRWKLASQPIRVQVGGGHTIVLDPVQADVLLRPDGHWVSAEKLDVRSSFGQAIGQGDLRGGDIQFNVDFDRLAAVLGRVLEISETTLGGSAQGAVRWSVDQRQIWSLNGSAATRQLVVNFPGVFEVERPRLDVILDASGVWTAGQLQRLDTLNVQLDEADQHWEITLTEPVQQPRPDATLPLRAQGSGDLGSLAMWWNHQLPAQLQEISGTIEADVRGRFSTSGGELRDLTATLRRPSMVYRNRRFRQETVQATFHGSLQFPNIALRCETLSISGNAVSLAMQGELDSQIANLEIAYRCDLAQLQGSSIREFAPLGGVLAGQSGRPSQNGTTQADWRMVGGLEGTATIQRRAPEPWAMNFAANGANVRLLQPPPVVYASQIEGPVRPSSAMLEPTELWAEEQFKIAGNAQWAGTGDALRLRGLKLETPWIMTQLDGTAGPLNESFAIQLNGKADWENPAVAARLTRLLGQPIAMTGRHSAPLRMQLQSRPANEPSIKVETRVGWDSAQLAGVSLGKATVPLTISERTIIVQPATLPLQRGQIHVAGEVHYRPGQLWFEQRPGTFAEGITLTPDLCRGWMQYMMPVAAQTTDVTGTFSVDLAECVVIPSNPVQSRVRGTLRIEGGSIGPGPLAQSVQATLDMVAAAARGLQGQPPTGAAARRWIQLEPQAVDFSLINGTVAHQRMRMRSGNVDLISSGTVSLGGQLGLGIEVPLRSQWLGADLERLAGRQLTIPIRGTLQQPRVDTSAVTAMIGNLGLQAAQSTAENYLQRQLDRQLQKLFGN